MKPARGDTSLSHSGTQRQSTEVLLAQTSLFDCQRPLDAEMIRMQPRFSLERHCYRAWVPHTTQSMGMTPNFIGVQICNLERDLVSGQTAGLLPHMVTRTSAHPTAVFSSRAHSQGGNQMIDIKDSFDMRLDTISQSHHKSIVTESTETFICPLEIF